MMNGNWMSLRSWLLLTPLLALMTVIIGWPMAKTVMVSFTDAQLLGGDVHWVGLANYQKVLAAPAFYSILWTTIRFVLISVGAAFL